MQGKLVRMLSTGRAGTKFIAGAFADQGYTSYHEDLYIGEPTSAVMLYIHMLGDLWKLDKDKYFSFESNFAQPYVRVVTEKLITYRDEAHQPVTKRIRDALVSQKVKPKPGFVVHTAHILTAATPLIERELERSSIESRNLILLRNPLRTIHALYIVEGGLVKGERPYRMFPASFSGDETFIGAADIWANTYRMAFDQKEYFGQDKFQLLELETFSKDTDYAANIFDFIELNFDPSRYKNFTKRELNKPLRSSKRDSLRNSHVFHKPDFVFSSKEIQRIYVQIQDVIELYGIDWGNCVEEYQQFHAKEKSQIGFD